MLAAYSSPERRKPKPSFVDRIEGWLETIFQTKSKSHVDKSVEEHYRIIKQIGEGEFAKVFLAQDLHSGQQVQIDMQVALKISSFQENDHDLLAKIARTRREIHIHMSLQHPNIVAVKECIQTHNRISVVMDYISGGELFEYIQQRGRIPEATARRFMRQLINAVNYMHRMGVVHRDLKLENILVDDYDNLIISDFGFSTARDNLTCEYLQTACGSPCYAAPEIVLDRNGYLGEPADVWSLGVIMFSMLYGHLPFENDLKQDMQAKNEGLPPSHWTPANVYQLYTFIQNRPLRLPKKPLLTHAARSLLFCMLDTSPLKRITIPEIMNHSWFLTEENNLDIV